MDAATGWVGEVVCALSLMGDGHQCNYAKPMGTTMSKSKYAFCGAGIGLTLTVFDFIFTVPGLGTSIPHVLFFAPLLFLINPLPLLIGLPLYCVGGIVQYMTYSLFLRWGIRRSQGKNILAKIVIIHFSSVGFMLCLSDLFSDYYRLLPRQFSKTPFLVIFSFSPFFIAILLAYYVVSISRTELDDYGHCDECGYNLTGNKSGVCPECGTTIPSGQIVRLKS